MTHHDDQETTLQLVKSINERLKDKEELYKRVIGYVDSLPHFLGVTALSVIGTLALDSYVLPINKSDPWCGLVLIIANAPMAALTFTSCVCRLTNVFKSVRVKSPPQS